MKDIKITILEQFISELEKELNENENTFESVIDGYNIKYRVKNRLSDLIAQELFRKFNNISIGETEIKQSVLKKLAEKIIDESGYLIKEEKNDSDM